METSRPRPKLKTNPRLSENDFSMPWQYTAQEVYGSDADGFSSVRQSDYTTMTREELQK